MKSIVHIFCCLFLTLTVFAQNDPGLAKIEKKSPEVVQFEKDFKALNEKAAVLGANPKARVKLAEEYSDLIDRMDTMFHPTGTTKEPQKQEHLIAAEASAVVSPKENKELSK